MSDALIVGALAGMAVSFLACVVEGAATKRLWDRWYSWGPVVFRWSTPLAALPTTPHLGTPVELQAGRFKFVSPRRCLCTACVPWRRRLFSRTFSKDTFPLKAEVTWNGAELRAVGRFPFSAALFIAFWCALPTVMGASILLARPILSTGFLLVTWAVFAIFVRKSISRGRSELQLVLDELADYLEQAGPR